MRKKLRTNKKNLEPANIKQAKPSGHPFKIRMGISTMETLWNDYTTKYNSNRLNGNEAKLYKKWGNALKKLSLDPFYPSLNSHEIDSLTKKYNKKIFESYLENNTPGAARMFWVYGPGKGEITILALEPHPEPGKYGSVKLDSEPG